ncbi:hypothetical protein LTR85_005857 [Meristemomyces frigidus]|nr:hypothetical protein LTR85_005857 [Meristemomyces frigidus]
MLGASEHAYGGKGPLILGITWAEALLTTIIVCARAYASITLVARAEWDLFWVVVAWVFSFVAQIFITISIAYGIGNHIAVLAANDIVQDQKWSWFGQIVAVLAIGFGKIGVIALLLRIQGPTHRKKSYFLHAIWITNTIINIVQIVLILKQCTPVQKMWNDSLAGNCDFRVTTSHGGFFQGSWAAASNLALAIYPITVFWSLHISWKRKLGLCALMDGGFIAAAAGVMKTIYIELITATTDATYAISPLVIWAYTEMWIIIILGSIPSLRVYFALASEKAGSMLNGSGHRQGGTRRREYSTEYTTHNGDIHLAGVHRPPAIIAGHIRHREAGDNESEENILAQDFGIVVKQDYSVTYADGAETQKV